MSLNNRYASFLKRIMDYVLTKISIIDYLIIDYTLSSLLVFVFSENKNNLIILQKRLSSFFFHTSEELSVFFFSYETKIISIMRNYIYIYYLEKIFFLLF